MKAISAIIATIMLLMISVSMIGIFYVFSSTMVSTTTGSGSQQASQLTAQLSSCMRIDNIYDNQITLRNCGKGVIENKSLVVTMDDVKLGASTTTITEGNSSVVNITGLWQISPGKHSLKISNGAAVAQNLVDVQPNKDGLVGSWSFNAGSGNIAADDSGNGNTGTLLPSGSEPTWVNGKFNKGLRFDGVNDYVNAGNGASLDITNAITVEAWINIGAFGTNQYRGIVGKTSDAIIDGCGYGYGLGSGWNSGNYFGFFLHFEGFTDCGRWVSSGFFLTNTWQYLVGTYDSTTGIMKIYRNGVLEGNRSEAAGTKIRSAPTKPVILGKNPDSSDWLFNGTIDEVRIWSKALAPDETIVMKQII